MMRRAFRQPQPPLPPDDSCQLFDKVLLGRSLRPMLGNKGFKQRPIFVAVFPRQDCVLRQHPMPKRVEAGDRVIAAVGLRQRDLNVGRCHDKPRRVAGTPAGCGYSAGFIVARQGYPSRRRDPARYFLEQKSSAPSVSCSRFDVVEPSGPTRGIAANFKSCQPFIHRMQIAGNGRYPTRCSGPGDIHLRVFLANS